MTEDKAARHTLHGPMYSLCDFGASRRLERFGPLLLDRPCSTASGAYKQRNPSVWHSADAVFYEDRKTNPRGRWEPKTEIGRQFLSSMGSELVDFGTLTLELRGTPFGHVGVFPEQMPNWGRIRAILREAAESRSQSIRVLNLFAYTGGSTLAAASAAMNVEVVHVDAARNLLGWAKRNASLNGLQNAKIRWIAEDARKFVRRERKRSNTYNAVILDPPTYGHGPHGEAWKLSEHLPDLLTDLFRLIEADPLFLLLTTHTPNIDLEAMLRNVLPSNGMDAVRTGMFLQAATGERLPAGKAVLLTVPQK